MVGSDKMGVGYGEMLLNRSVFVSRLGIVVCEKRCCKRAVQVLGRRQLEEDDEE